ncbi:hypothetical protein [Kitasatospora purpeofusca]
MTAADPAEVLAADLTGDLTGGEGLRPVVTDAGDGLDHDRTDRADPG